MAGVGQQPAQQAGRARVEPVGWALEGVRQQQGAAAEDTILMIYGPPNSGACLLLQPPRVRPTLRCPCAGADLCQYPLEACNGMGTV